MICETLTTYNSERANIERSFSQIYKVSKAIAERVGSTIAMPRIAARQHHRSNIPAGSVQEHFQRNIAIPFLDHIIVSINWQFSKSAISLLGLVPSVICSQDVNLEDALIKYRDDLPSPELMDAELRRWTNRYMTIPHEKRPSYPAKAIKDCDATDFPNISGLLAIACTIPVTSCECERSASVLRRLNNYMRASMGKDRLSHLALLHIHYEAPIDLDSVVDIYARLHPRRLELDSVLLN